MAQNTKRIKHFKRFMYVIISLLPINRLYASFANYLSMFDIFAARNSPIQLNINNCDNDVDSFISHSNGRSVFILKYGKYGIHC